MGLVGKDLTDRTLKSPEDFKLSKFSRDSLEGILIPKSEIKKRVSLLSDRIAEDYAGKNFYAMCVLTGSVPFFKDLLFNKNMTVPFEYGCIRISSYVDTSSGELRYENFDLNEIRGKNVLIVEDILDTGHTLAKLVSLLQGAPKSLQIAVLLDKPSRREVKMEADYVGFTIPNKFVVGYGLDYNNQYRYLQHIGVLKKEMYGG